MYMYIHMFIHIHIYKYINKLSALPEMLRTSAHERGALAWGGFVLYPKWGRVFCKTKNMFAKTAKPRSDAALVWEQSECLARPTYPHITITRCADQPRQAQRSPARPSLAWPKAAAWLSSDQPSREINRAQRSPGWHSSQAYPVQSVRPARLPSPAQPSPVQLDPASLTSPASPALPGLPQQPGPAQQANPGQRSPANPSWAASLAQIGIQLASQACVSFSLFWGAVLCENYFSTF